MVVIVKHEGEFCLWPTSQPSYSIKNSQVRPPPWLLYHPSEDGWTMQQLPPRERDGDVP